MSENKDDEKINKYKIIEKNEKIDEKFENFHIANKINIEKNDYKIYKRGMNEKSLSNKNLLHDIKQKY